MEFALNVSYKGKAAMGGLDEDSGLPITVGSMDLKVVKVGWHLTRCSLPLLQPPIKEEAEGCLNEAVAIVPRSWGKREAGGY